jgi:hypothetical protein
MQKSHILALSFIIPIRYAPLPPDFAYFCFEAFISNYYNTTILPEDLFDPVV